MRRWIGKAGAMALVGVAAATASAQTSGPTGWSVRLGLFIPSHDVASALSDTWFSGGLDFKLDRYSVEAPTNDTRSFLSLSADWYEQDGIRNIPVALNYNVRAGQTVWHVGAGPDFRNFLGDGVGLHAQVGWTYEFYNRNSPNTPFFVQVKYFIASKPELNGFGAYVGLRF